MLLLCLMVMAMVHIVVSSAFMPNKEFGVAGEILEDSVGWAMLLDGAMKKSYNRPFEAFLLHDVDGEARHRLRILTLTHCTPTELAAPRGGRRDRTLYADPPPPPSLPGFGPEVPDHGRQRRPKQILLDLVEGEKLGFCPMCLYSKYSVFLGEPNSG